MNKPVTIELLEKYVDGECTPEEVALVKEWYFSFENETDHVTDLTLAEEKELEEHIYHQIINKIGVADDAIEIDEPQETGPQHGRFKIGYAVAAIAAMLLVAVALFFNSKPQLNADKQVADAHVQEFVQITNSTQQIYKRVLPDNSVVWMSPNTKISFPKVFDARYRAITMSGECFFEVTKNPKRPFIINSNSIITKVWGTSFRVRDNLRGSSVDVSVLTGKVSVSIKGKEKADDVDYALRKDEVILYPHQKVVYLADKNVLKPESTDGPAMKVWYRVNLAFENKPLSEIIPVLNSKFNVHIKVMDEKLNHYILNADMVGFNLADVLEAFKKSLNVNYEIKNNAIELE